MTEAEHLPAAGLAPLSGYRVIELSVGIAGAYCCKILADGGAEVLKVEPPDGDPLRRRTVTGGDVSPALGGALFQYLCASKRSVVGRPDVVGDVEMVERLIAGCDAVVWSPGTELAEQRLQIARIRSLAPHACVVTITPFGLTGPWSDRAATSATLEAWSGAAGQRGRPSRPPVLAGFEPAEWLGGMFAALGALTTLYQGVGDLLDVSILESLVVAGSAMYPATFHSIAGVPWRSVRAQNLPDVHPTKDGFVGFMIVTGQQWSDFCVMIGRPEWTEDESLFYFANRNLRREELVGAINDWTSAMTTAEITELASMLRVPAAPVTNGATLPTMDHVEQRRLLVPEPRGQFVQPDVPYRLGGGRPSRPFEPSPILGADTGHFLAEPCRAPASSNDASGETSLPFEGLRVADLTAFWAGPIIGSYLGAMGADVIHIESPKRPDGMRYGPVRKPGEPDWWEWSPLFHGPNTNKRAITLDLDTKRGMELARDVIRHCDVVVENFSPRVLDNWGLDYSTLRQLRPDILLVRAPAFGVSGPWRNWGGYAQTIEDASGMSYLTGYPEDEPQVLNGICDPVGGIHATIALLLALHQRRRDGDGAAVEAPMLLAAMNIAAEPVIEYSAYGGLLERSGNAGLLGAPQGVYLTADIEAGVRDRWVAISVIDDDQWRALCDVVGLGDIIDDPRFATATARRHHADALDHRLAEWCASAAADEIVARLSGANVPVGVVSLPHEQTKVEQLAARDFFEEVEHPLLGTVVHSGFPVHFASRRRPFNISPAPLFGQHNDEVLGELLGLDREAIDRLTDEGIVSRRPVEPEMSWGV